MPDNAIQWLWFLFFWLGSLGGFAFLGLTIIVFLGFVACLAADAWRIWRRG